MFHTTVKHVIGNGTHETERYNQLIEDFTDAEIFKPRLYPSDDDVKQVMPLQSGNYICIAPASVWYTKQLVVEKWIELCNRTSEPTAIYLLGAPGDTELCEKIRSVSVHSNIRNLAGKLSLLQSTALMKNAKMNYVNDSSPLHLASSVNAHVTAFFCSTVPAFGFGPLSNESKVIEVEGLECKPCGLHGYKACPLGHFKCSHLIDLDKARVF